MIARPLNIIFAGTPDFSVPALQALIDSEHHILAVYTQPDRPAGRGRKLKMSPVKQLVLEHNLRVEQPVSVKTEIQKISDLTPDLMVVVAYGQILTQSILDIPKYGCMNVHASILPKWRGAAPIHRAIEAGDTETGVTIMQMDKGLDTGDMLLTKMLAIDLNETMGDLHDALAQTGAEALMETIRLLKSNALVPQIQNHNQATYAHKIEKSEANIDWASEASAIHNKIRAFNPWPVAQAQYAGQIIRIWKSSIITESGSNQMPGVIVSVKKDGVDVATQQGILRIEAIQVSGGKCISVGDFLNAHADFFQVDKKFHIETQT